jgi:hypothetical protein
MSTQTSNNDSNDGPPETYTALQNVSRGDVITINGTPYRVVILHTGLRALLGPEYPTIVDPDGNTHDLRFGRIDGADADGVIFHADLSDDPQPSDLLAGYDDVTIREGDPETVFDVLPTTEADTCPCCENDTATFEYGERDGLRTRELRKCTADDCDTWFVRDRTLNPSDTATVTVVTPNDDEETLELSGVYRETITSRFKMDPRQNTDERWLQASEVAAFLRKKMDSDPPFGVVKPDGHRVLHDGPTWKDQKYGADLLVQFAPVELDE